MATSAGAPLTRFGFHVEPFLDLRLTESRILSSRVVYLRYQRIR
jgi:hypothetical protein